MEYSRKKRGLRTYGIPNFMVWSIDETYQGDREGMNRKVG